MTTYAAASSAAASELLSIRRYRTSSFGQVY